MDKKTILKLVDAGFNKDEIMELAGKGKDNVPDPTPDPKAPEVPPEDLKPETPPAPAGVTMSDEQFNALIQKLNVGNASIDVPPEMDVTEKLGEHFKELMIGK